MGVLVPKNLGDDTECYQLHHQGRPRHDLIKKIRSSVVTLR